MFCQLSLEINVIFVTKIETKYYSELDRGILFHNIPVTGLLRSMNFPAILSCMSVS